ncbi:MAG: cytochrome c biogenesis CcdA family protein [Sphaerochaeta sp.]
MAYFTAFLEGLLSFISPCVLPMIPLYIGYLAGGTLSDKDGELKENHNLIKNSISFVLGFTLFFVALGASASFLGTYLNEHLDVINRVGGVIVIIFALSFLGLKFLPFLENTHKLRMKTTGLGIFSSLLFGIVFAIGWSPCTGPFLGSALMLAANSDTLKQGVFTLFCYAMGLGVPFLLSAVLMKQLEGTFSFIKKHYKVVNLISGILLLVMGIFMVLGYSPAQLFV